MWYRVPKTRIQVPGTSYQLQLPGNDRYQVSDSCSLDAWYYGTRYLAPVHGTLDILRVHGIWCWVGTSHLTIGAWSHVPGTQYLLPGSQYQLVYAPAIWPCVCYQVPVARYHVPTVAGHTLNLGFLFSMFLNGSTQVAGSDQHLSTSAH
jgi:hypothetical protein